MNEKMYSLREMVMAQREAFCEGAAWQRLFGVQSPSLKDSDKARRKAREQSVNDYPLPAIDLGKFAGREYRLRDGVLEYATKTHSTRAASPYPTTEPNWDRATLQPEDVRHLAHALEEIANAS